MINMAVFSSYPKQTLVLRIWHVRLDQGTDMVTIMLSSNLSLSAPSDKVNCKSCNALNRPIEQEVFGLSLNKQTNLGDFTSTSRGNPSRREGHTNMDGIPHQLLGVCYFLMWVSCTCGGHIRHWHQWQKIGSKQSPTGTTPVAHQRKEYPLDHKIEGL